jgi:Tfp pilus assembly protein PilO
VAAVETDRLHSALRKEAAMLAWLWIPILVVAIALHFLLKPQYDKFHENQKKEQTKPEKYPLT